MEGERGRKKSLPPRLSRFSPSPSLAAYACYAGYKPSRSFPKRALMSSSVPPFLAHNAPEERELAHLLYPLPTAINTPSPPLVPKRISFVVALIFIHTFAPCSSKECVLSLMSCILCDSRARSSAKSRSSKGVVMDYWIPLSWQKPFSSPN